MSYKQVEQPVAIVVCERTPGTPTVSVPADVFFFRDVFKKTMIVMIEAVLAVVGYVEIFPAVVVVVANTNSLSPSRRAQPHPLGDIHEGAVMSITVKPV